MQVREGFLEEVGEQGKDLGRREERGEGRHSGQGRSISKVCGQDGPGLLRREDGMVACREGEVQDFNFTLYSCVF